MQERRWSNQGFSVCSHSRFPVGRCAEFVQPECVNRRVVSISEVKACLPLPQERVRIQLQSSDSKRGALRGWDTSIHAPVPGSTLLRCRRGENTLVSLFSPASSTPLVAEMNPPSSPLSSAIILMPMPGVLSSPLLPDAVRSDSNISIFEDRKP
ncbi:hypothetical protein EmuJ_000059900 [Echinococcus multilocularis]|uniref:Uncharacterized protein n=1 Tax=Echinococcus multilocularis TaxID=6211 RepID=A0A087VXG7_ECHMU|nr:hypothetical protein EmuJ_000059900 [Echinococcus multilocularis]